MVCIRKSHLPSLTPGLADVCATLNRRGDGGTGGAVLGRLTSGPVWATQTCLEALQESSSAGCRCPEPDGRRQRHSLSNLFCLHPPFEIDGNCGGAAGIVARCFGRAMRVSSICCPPAGYSWSTGNFRGMRAQAVLLSTSTERRACWVKAVVCLCRAGLP